MGYRKIITFSFDDGITQDRRLVRLFNKYTIPCTFNLNSGLLGQENTLAQEGTVVNHTKVDASEVRDLYAGHEIAAHTLTHPNLTTLSEDEIVTEAVQDKEKLEELSGQSVIGLAYPGGHFDEMVMQTLEQETPLCYGRTIVASGKFEFPQRWMAWHPTCHIGQDNLFELADAFDKAEPESDMLFYVWGHAYEFDVNEARWERMEAFLQRVRAMEGVEFLTNGEIYKQFADA